jgi:hypothetical protein
MPTSGRIGLPFGRIGSNAKPKSMWACLKLGTAQGPSMIMGALPAVNAELRLAASS